MATPLATVGALTARLGRDLAADEVAAANAALADASALVRLETGADWLDAEGAVNAPAAVVTVTVQCALRALRNPEGFTSETVGEFSYRRTDEAASVYLTDAERAVLRKVSGSRGVWTLRTSAEYPEAEDYLTGWVEDSFGCEPFPYYPMRPP